ncbi:MAG: sugar ABC transporter substrate-binding protein [Caulobacteraceae bacterium]
MSPGPTRRAALGQLAAGPLAACSSGGASGTTLRFWAMGREGEVVQSLMPAFEAANPGMRVEVQQLPWSAAHAKLLTAFAGGDLPDLCQMGNTWLPEFAALRALEPLDGPVAASSVIAASDDFAGIWRTNQVGGALVGIPWYVDTRLLFYRRDLLAEAGFGSPPSTWAAWLEAMEAIKRRVGVDDYAALLPLNEPEPLLTLALQQDDPLLADGGGRGNFQSPGFKAALDFYAEIFRRRLAPPSADTQIANLYDEFARGYFSFYVTGPWNLGEFRRRLPAGAQDIWMTAPMPGPRGPGAGIAGGSSLVLLRRSRRKDEAWRLIEYLSARGAQSRFCALTGDLPARREVWNDAFLAKDAKAAAFRDQLTRVKPTPQVPEWEEIATEMQRVAEKMVAGPLSVDAAAAEIDRRVDRLLEKRRWMLAREPGEPA